MAFLRASEELCRAEGLSLRQYEFLLQIGGHRGSISLGELVERLQLSLAEVSALVADGAERGTVMKHEREGGNQQSNEVQLTAEGSEILGRIASIDLLASVPFRARFR